MSGPPQGRPDHAPQGFEWLPDAYRRDIEPLGPKALEQIRQALADGRVEATLRTPHGERHPIPDRVWDKDQVHTKVYPRFQDGWMRVKYGPEKTPVLGWVFVHSKMWSEAVAAGGVHRALAVFSEAQFRGWYERYVLKCKAEGVIPSRDDDVRAAREQFHSGVPKHKVHDARRDLAPSHWKTPGPRKSADK